MATTAPDRPRAGDRLETELRAHAFGIDITAGFAAPGLPAGAPQRPLPAVRLELVARAEINAIWRPEAPERLLQEELGGKTPARTIDRDERLGHRLYARHFGLALITAEADRVLCAPPGVAAWRWQRFLVGRVLPWVALLRGHEVFHASAVRIGDHAIAFVAPTGGGKTSLALRLALRGAGFVTDDVLALELDGAGGVIAHPGAGIVSVRPAEKAVVDRRDWRRLGQVLGTSGKTYVEVPRESGPLPLGGVYFLEPKPGGGTRIDAGGVNARTLLGSSFVSSVQRPDRLIRLLDVCAAVAAGVPLFRAQVDPDEGSHALAAAVHDHALGMTGAAA
jgi:hypothetical protein